LNNTLLNCWAVSDIGQGNDEPIHLIENISLIVTKNKILFSEQMNL